MGWSDLGCYGSEIPTPNLDALAASGVRFTQFYNTARCCPTRASLLTGLYPHQAGVGHMMDDRNLQSDPLRAAIVAALKDDPAQRDLAAAVHRRMLEHTGLEDFGLVGAFNYHPIRRLTWMPAILVEQGAHKNFAGLIVVRVDPDVQLARLRIAIAARGDLRPAERTQALGQQPRLVVRGGEALDR